MNRFAILLPALLLATPAAAQHQAGNAGHMSHGDMIPVTETGQGAFAAIAEIVARIEADPATDWTTIDIAALREHLVDMDLVTTRAAVVVRPQQNGLAVAVSGTGRVAEAIRRMVIAHTGELAKIEGWLAVAEPRPDGAMLTVTSTKPGQISRIKGLGFFGLMATGAHHQAHHWAIATGGDPHG